jgi:sterol-4alpha-carboxylate 3-dehydrogenase (decarboxylating)
LAIIVNFFVELLRPVMTINPTFTKLKVIMAGTHHWYNISAAKRDLSTSVLSAPYCTPDHAMRIEYKPVISLKDGLKDALDTVPHLRNPVK